MKYLKSINEMNTREISQEEIDNILDKINSNGIDSLSKKDRYILKQYSTGKGEPNYIKDTKNKVISKIRVLIGDDEYTMSELEADSNPVIKSDYNLSEQVESVSSEAVFVVVYTESGSEIGEYYSNLEDLDLDVLYHLLEILENAIEFGFIN